LVFISWSGSTGKAIADALGEWLETVLYGVKPWISSQDINKGTRWSDELLKALNNSKAGLFCITSESLNSKWMIYELGVIDSNKKQSLICPIVFGSEELDIGPYGMYQRTSFDKTDFLYLAISIANHLNLESNFSKDIFDHWWPDLENKINTILKNQKSYTKRTTQELAIETLNITQDIPYQIQTRVEKIFQERSFGACLKRFGVKVQATANKMENSINEFAQNPARSVERIGNNIAREVKITTNDIKRSWKRAKPIEKGKETFVELKEDLHGGVTSIKKWFKDNL